MTEEATASSAGTDEAGVELAPGVRVAAPGLRFQFARSSGPGGQNVNKVNTKAELWLDVAALVGPSAAAVERLKKIVGKQLTKAGEIHVAAESSRSQEGNRQDALARLREMLVEAMREPKPRRKTKPSAGARRRRLEAKRRRGQVKAMRRGGGE